MRQYLTTFYGWILFHYIDVSTFCLSVHHWWKFELFLPFGYYEWCCYEHPCTHFYLCIYFWLRWVFVAACGLPLVAARGGYSLLWYTGFSCCRARALGPQASVVVAHGLSCSMACGNLPRPGLEPMSPALAGGFLINAPPGKSPWTHFL